MDQVKVGLNFVWKHRFWFALGLTVLLSIATYPAGATALIFQANKRKSELDGVYSGVEKFKSSPSPNQKNIALAQETHAAVEQDVNQLWEKLYRQQQSLMTWPKDLQGRFGHRPFLADLSEESNTYLIKYFREPEYFTDQIFEIYYMLDPIEVQEDGQIFGTVASGLHVIQSATFETVPNSSQAWLAQEQLWIQREIIRAIANANEPAMKLPDATSRWKNAAVRSLMYINIGAPALDTSSLNVQLISALEGEPNAPPVQAGPQASFGMAGAGRTQDKSKIDPIRYIEKNEQYRIIPVSVVMLADQMKIPQILTHLSNANFNFVITQVNISVPDKPVELPPELRDAAASRSAESDEEEENEEEFTTDHAIFNTMQLEVYGRMRIYHMPPAMKEEYTKAIEQGQYVRELGAPVETPSEEGEATTTPPASSEETAPPANAPTPAADAKAEPNSEPTAEPKAEIEAAPKTEPAAEPKAEPESEPKGEPAGEPKSDQPAATPPAPEGEQPKEQP